ncbi:GNVR domain-containing protein [Tellurirhabdus bombi]|uniref:GNVR domain-containing protein n=1 Tax=Tellurirhabdus bombi TaxID=2907205 RepID=UPI001F472325|nr:GNVR domain-containing protein [Tellurirhabdus bombi]
MSTTELKQRDEVDVRDNVIELRLSDIFDFLRDNRLKLLLFGLVGAVIGAVYGFSKPNEYKSQVAVLPELQSKTPGSSMGGLSSLAGLAGIDLNSLSGSGTDAIRPDLYPNVLQSFPFALYLLKQPVYSHNFNKTMTLSAYLKEQAGKGLFGGSGEEEQTVYDPKNFSKAIQVTKNQDRQVQDILARIGTIFDKKTGIITIEATLPDPVVAATVARFSLEYLTNYVTSYRTEKARSQSNFLNRRVAEARRRYQSAEYALENYRDRNRSLYSNVAKLEEQRLQADFMLAQGVYNDLSKQLEQAKIKVQEETPVFKMLEPARVPLQKSGPKRTLIILYMAIGGVVVGTLWTLFQSWRKSGSF